MLNELPRRGVLGLLLAGIAVGTVAPAIARTEGPAVLAAEAPGSQLLRPEDLDGRETAYTRFRRRWRRWRRRRRRSRSRRDFRRRVGRAPRSGPAAAPALKFN